jgi:hypothetical protein
MFIALKKNAAIAGELGAQSPEQIERHIFFVGRLA